MNALYTVVLNQLCRYDVVKSIGNHDGTGVLRSFTRRTKSNQAMMRRSYPNLKLKAEISKDGSNSSAYQLPKRRSAQLTHMALEKADKGRNHLCYMR